MFVRLGAAICGAALMFACSSAAVAESGIVATETQGLTVRIESFEGPLDLLHAALVGRDQCRRRRLGIDQALYPGLGLPEGSVPHSEAAARRVISLPMHPYLDDDTQRAVVVALQEAVAG